MNRFALVAFLVLLIPSLASAQNHYWLKKDNPDTLPVTVSSGKDCPISEEAIKEETQNVLIRSRIKPARGGTPIGWGIGFGDRPYLLVIVRCIQLSGSKSTVAAQITIELSDLIDLKDPYSDKSPFDEQDIKPVRYGEAPYHSTLLVGKEDYLRSSLREAVEDFMADYLKVNFDLGEDEKGHE